MPTFLFVAKNATQPGDREKVVVCFPQGTTKEQAAQYVSGNKQDFPLDYEPYFPPPTDRPEIVCEQYIVDTTGSVPFDDPFSEPDE